jgi:hypothetical protein
MNLSKCCKITVVSAGDTAAQTELDSSVLDMAGFDGVMFVAITGDVTTGCVLTLTVKGNTANSISSPSPITQKATTAFTADGTSADNKVIMVDVAKPPLRYIFAALTRTAANAVINGIIAIQYCGKEQPTTHDVSVIASAFGVGVAA